VTCSTIQYQLPDFVRGTLAGDASTDVADHLTGCDACNADAGQLRSLFEQLDRTKPIASPSAAYWATTLPRVHARLDQRQTFIVPGWMQNFALPVAAAIVACVFVVTMIPFNAGGASGDLQATIQQFEPEELQDIAQQQTIAGFIEPVADDERTVTSDADTDVLQELLAGEDDQSALADIDHETLIESLDERGTDDLVAMLGQAEIH